MRNSNFATNVWKPAVEATGLPEGLRIHDLRRTAVASRIGEGVHSEAIGNSSGTRRSW
jgi:integrase